MKTKLLIAGLAVLGSISLSAYTYEVQPLVGQNFTESGAAVDDSTAYGIRINKYISQDNAIMFGYTRITDADYNKNVIKAIRKNGRSCGIDPCKSEPVDPCKNDPCKSAPVYTDSCDVEPCKQGNTNSSSNTNNPANGQNVADMGDVNNPANGQNVADMGDANQPHMPVDNNTKKPTKKLEPKKSVLNSGTSGVSTDIDRFYVNGLHNINLNYNRLTPYIYAGFGYERVDKEYNDLKSQGFFDAGLGLKFKITDRVNILADVQGIKKFRDNDLDILASLGLGFFFGANTQSAPEVEAAKVVPQETKREITIIKVKPETVPTNAVPAEMDEAVVPSGDYYIQLAAAFKTDIEKGCHFTDELKKEGIAYDVKYITIKGKNVSILVTGPYSSREEAKEELAKIRTISKDAFIRKIEE